MEFNYFDLVVTAIILLLGLKGIINGFFKELFGLIGIIGGIFIASRMGDEVGLYLSDNIFKFDNSSAISFTGFLVTLALFWFAMILIGALFKKLSSLSGLGIVDKLLGFVFGSSKFFLIAAVIAYSTHNIKAVKSTIDSALGSSILFPILVSTGGFIMKMDPAGISNDINNTVNKTTKTVTSKVNETVKKEMTKKIDEITEEINKTSKEGSQ